MDPGAGLQRFQRIVDVALAERHALAHLDLGAEVAADLHRLHRELAVGLHRGDAQALLVEDQRGRRDAQRAGIGGDVELHLGEGAGPEPAVGVVGLQLDQRLAGVLGHRARPALDDQLRRALVGGVAEVGVRLGLLHAGLQLHEVGAPLGELLVEVGG